MCIYVHLDIQQVSKQEGRKESKKNNEKTNNMLITKKTPTNKSKSKQTQIGKDAHIEEKSNMTSA